MPAKFDRQLGTGFVIREFHAQMPMPGALPMMIPEQKIDDWIAEKKAGLGASGGRFAGLPG